MFVNELVKKIVINELINVGMLIFKVDVFFKYVLFFFYNIIYLVVFIIMSVNFEFSEDVVIEIVSKFIFLKSNVCVSNIMK